MLFLFDIMFSKFVYSRAYCILSIVVVDLPGVGACITLPTHLFGTFTYILFILKTTNLAKFSDNICLWFPAFLSIY